MIFRDNQKFHLPVDAAVKCKIRHLGIHPVVFAVIHLHSKQIMFFQFLCDIRPECGISVVVAADFFSVQQHMGAGVDAVELQIHPFSCLKLRHRNLFFIDAGSSEIIVSAVLAILGIPGMGQIYLLPGSLWPGKRPAVHKPDNSSFRHSYLPPF